MPLDQNELKTQIKKQASPNSDRFNQEHLILALRSAALGAWETDLETGENTWDQGTADLLGIPADQIEVMSKHWTDYIHPEDRDVVSAIFRAAGQQGTPYSPDFRVVRTDGAIRWFNSRGVVVTLPDGRRKMVGIVQDITERKAKEEALRESEERLRVAQELSPDGFTIFRPLRDSLGHVVDFMWVYENAAIAKLNGTDPVAVVGRRLLDVLPSHADSPFHRVYQNVAASGKPMVLEAPFLGETMAEEKWFRVAVVPMKGDIAILAQDITERKKAEEVLERERKQLLAIIESLDEAVGVWNLDGSLVLINDATAKLYGFEIKEQMLKHLSEYADVQVRTMDGCELPQEEWPPSRVLRGETFSNWELEQYIPSINKRFIGSNSGRPARDANGKIILGVTSVRDITEHKRAEDNLRKLNETLEQQVAERTQQAETRAKQLQALAVELIETEERERRQFSHLLHEDLQQLLASAKMQVQAVADKLSFEPMLLSATELLVESIEKSRRLSQDLSPALLHQAGLIANLNWLTKQMKERFDLHVELDVNSELLMERTPQKVFLFRAVQELLLNVVKHADVKNAKVEVASSEDSISLTVSDHGKGFNPGMLIKSVSSAGLGLLTIKERASHIGGTFTIESSPGQGCRFILSIPNAAANDYVEMTTETTSFKGFKPPQYQMGASTSNQTRVLFVDDHQVMRQGLIGLVKGQPTIHVVGEASNGLEALEQARKLTPDVIVMDISMPKMDGIEATRRIKADLQQVRIIGLTMHDDEQLTGAMQQAGAELVLKKTTSATELIKAIIVF
jgi:PAS domain S-box-containing protein